MKKPRAGIQLDIKTMGDFIGGLVVKNLPASAGNMGSIPGPGGFHNKAREP